MKRKILSFIKNPVYRIRTMLVLTCLFLFLFPFIGWNPLLILWTISLCFVVYELRHSKIRFFYIGIIVVFIAMIVFNLVMRFRA